MRTFTPPAPEQHLGAVMTWHAVSADTGGSFSLGEVFLHPGTEPPLHIHAREEECWYILEGSILFQVGMERTLRGPGQAIVLPRGVQHGFAVQSSSARILHFYTPGGIEAAFRSVNATPVEAAFEARGVTFVGPPLPVLLEAEKRP